jgi:hypothetical protein
MLILRKYSRRNKIKNRYIITMVYKSRKINRKNLQKRQSRRRMYGGDVNVSSLQVPEITKVKTPTMSDNLEDVSNLAASAVTNVVADGIGKLSESVGLDPNKSVNETVKDMSNSIGNVVDALNSPEGERLKKEASELLSESLDIAKPSIEKGQEILAEGVKKIANTGNSIVMTALNEIPPVFLLNELSKFGTAAAQAGETVAELTTTGAEAVESLENQKKKAESLLSNFKSVLSGVNKGVSGMITSAQKEVDKYGQHIVEDGSLKKYQKEATMIGGRTKKSQLEFLSPYATRSQIIQQYGGKWHTRRRHRNRHRLTARRN